MGRFVPGVPLRKDAGCISETICLTGFGKNIHDESGQEKSLEIILKFPGRLLEGVIALAN